MSLVNVGHMHWPPSIQSTNPTHFALTIDAADEVAAGVFQVPRAGTIVRVHFCTGAVTTGATVDVRLETVGGDGLPTGTLFGANTHVSHVIADTDDFAWMRTAALTGSATVSAGDLLAVVVVNPSVSAGTMNLCSTDAAYHSIPIFPYALTPNRSTKNPGMYMICALEYDDGTFAVPAGCLPMAAGNNGYTVASNTNPDEVAIRFNPPMDCRVSGWTAVMAVSAGGDYRVNLYEDGNNTPLLTRDYDGDTTGNTGNNGHSGYFNGTAVLAAGTVYRLGFLPTTVNSYLLRFWDAPASWLNTLDEIPGTKELYTSTRNRTGTTDPDAAAWSDVTNRRLLAGLIIDRLDDGKGAGRSYFQLGI